jgi:hypothetical protein
MFWNLPNILEHHECLRTFQMLMVKISKHINMLTQAKHVNIFSKVCDFRLREFVISSYSIGKRSGSFSPKPQEWMVDDSDFLNHVPLIFKTFVFVTLFVAVKASCRYQMTSSLLEKADF